MCQTKFGLTPQYDWVFDFFGGLDIEKDFNHLSNIIFSNGQLDPWSAGGVLKQVSPDIVIIYMLNAAHHLDLRTPNEVDDPSVKAGRQLEIDTIKKWIVDYQTNKIY